MRGIGAFLASHRGDYGMEIVCALDENDIEVGDLVMVVPSYAPATVLDAVTSDPWQRVEAVLSIPRPRRPEVVLRHPEHGDSTARIGFPDALVVLCDQFGRKVTPQTYGGTDRYSGLR